MSHPVLPWRNVALELVGYAPDSLRRRAAHLRRRVTTLTSDQELDRHLDRAAELFPHDDDAARRYLAGFELAAPPMPPDPFSSDYVAAQWDLYRRVAQRDRYETANEESEIELGRCVQAPYPYSTGSCGQVADQLAACSWIVRLLAPRPGQRIVEFGPGWGNLTLQLAMMGVEVTAVEVSPAFGELLRRRAAGNQQLTVVCCDMLEFEARQRYDAAVFFESFHHCSDHLAMLKRLRSTVRDDGVVVLAAEPVTSMPYPWGLRLDGLSLWCTRRYGWLELGFSGRYFDEALRRTGWVSERRRSRSMTALADVIIARRRD
jgi:2-polyprenyl-3-methyl-5-hydroxy-6-metoxy-1,4-benzoquinol methylase